MTDPLANEGSGNEASFILSSLGGSCTKIRNSMLRWLRNVQESLKQAIGESLDCATPVYSNIKVCPSSHLCQETNQ